MDVWYGVAKGVVRAYMALFMDVKVDGQENIPPGPKIIVGNHPHVTDAFVLPFLVQEKIHFTQVFGIHSHKRFGGRI